MPRPENGEILKDISFINSINSMAVIGTSKRRDFFFLRNHQENFKGDLYAIHPKIKKIPNFDDGTQGRIYPSIKDVPEPVDFAFIAVPPKQILNVMRDCRKKGVKLVSIFTAEFSDSGTEEGRRLEERLLKESDGEVRILGPNGMGLFYPKLGIAWRPKFPHQPGNIGLIAQSGGMCNIAIYASQRLGINFSKVFSYGNGADLDFVDLLNFLSEDPETDIILGYIEGIQQERGKIFQKVLSKCKKPIIMLKGGKSEKGSEAVKTHTASVAGSNSIWKALWKQHRVIEVNTLEELLHTSRLLDCYGRFHIDNLAVLSISGGYGVILVDLIEKYGMKVPHFSPNIQSQLDEKFFTLGTSSTNPLDVSAQIYASKAIYNIIDIALADPKIDGLIMDLPSWYFDLGFHIKKDHSFEPNMVDALSLGHKHKKPIIPIIQRVNCPAARERVMNKLKKRKVPVFGDPMEFIPLIRKITKSIDK